MRSQGGGGGIGGLSRWRESLGGGAALPYCVSHRPNTLPFTYVIAYIGKIFLMEPQVKSPKGKDATAIGFEDNFWPEKADYVRWQFQATNKLEMLRVLH